MTLDPTIRETNVKDSLRKFFIDNLSTTSEIPLTFDKYLSVPKLQGIEVKRWVSIVFGVMLREDECSATFDIYCCTRSDSEGMKLAQLTDTVMGYLTGTDSGDGTKRITLYRSYPSPTPWVKIGGMVITRIDESGNNIAEDGTKFKILSCLIKWAGKMSA